MPHPPAHTETSTRSCGARRCQSLGHEYVCQSLWKQLPFTTVVVQVNQIVDKLPRIDIPASWIDVVVKADRPFAIEPLFTRDPRHIEELQILIGMMVIRGIYERHQVHSLPPGHVLSDLANENLSDVHSIPVEPAVLPRVLRLAQEEEANT
jgi:hypothetical protein